MCASGVHVDAGQQRQSDAAPSLGTGLQAPPNAKEQLRRERKDKVMLLSLSLKVITCMLVLCLIHIQVCSHG